ncbi:MAG: pilus assembly PilX N-terminal domain-containing protein [Deferrisomatales bacterium]|nr:pilus assembly PilX N-terminal domain-containing protein [Deferrisomatales bacterium]
MSPQPAGRALPRRHRKGESGMVLVAAMLVMAMLAILSVAGIATSTLEVKIASHDRGAKQAFYLCEAGLERARYEAVKSWGAGDGDGAFPTFSFQFDEDSLPAVLKDAGGGLFWGAVPDKWANFTLVDRRGLLFRILRNDTAYGITECTGPVEAPASDRAALFFELDGADVVALANEWGEVEAANTSVILRTGAAWADGMWAGYLVSERGLPGGTPPVLYEVLGNTADTLTVAGTLPVGNFPFEIWRAAGAVNAPSSQAGGSSFRLYEADPQTNAGAPGGPNPVWRDNGETFEGWFLRDRSGALLQVTATVYGTTAGGARYMELALAGSPASGAFQLVTNPWLVEQSALTAAGTPSSWAGLEGPAGVDYGDVTLHVSPEPGAPGAYRLRSVSSGRGTGDAKEIHITARVSRNGQVELRDWVLTR